MGREKGTKRIYDNETREQEKHKREAREKKNLHGDANVFFGVGRHSLQENEPNKRAAGAKKKAKCAAGAEKNICFGKFLNESLHGMNCPWS